MVAVGGRADPSRCRIRMARRWRKKALKRMKALQKTCKRSEKETGKAQRLAARQEASRKVRESLREALLMSGNSPVRDIRAQVSAAVEIRLDQGHAKIFFDRCLANYMKGRRATRRRSGPSVRLGSSLASSSK